MEKEPLHLPPVEPRSGSGEESGRLMPGPPRPPASVNLAGSAKASKSIWKREPSPATYAVLLGISLLVLGWFAVDSRNSPPTSNAAPLKPPASSPAPVAPTPSQRKADAVKPAAPAEDFAAPMPPKYARWAAQLDAVVAQCEQWAIDGRTVANVSRNLLPAYITARGLDVAFLKAKAAGVAVDDDIPNACVEGYLLGRGKP